MFQPEPITPPIEIPQDFGTVRLTHRIRVMQVDPRSRDSAVVLHEMRGYLNAAGEFQDWGDPVPLARGNRADLDALLNDTTGGKPAGVFRTDDVERVIRARQGSEAEPEAQPRTR